ncbi:hypothetical protein MCOR25_003753 [Pyricularia grisea]|uniref:LITAF domain-containing protein n=1 Tax=Pyricularia grisea TaxID=148305 RepID=A0A6P8B9I9_PYRGI|nr:uncharacterized protein PgNI_04958 [Pyricularia grisea]KAI6372432.1 hypothetical protein MCOR25_003753 [Pyricularia grisea]TLD12332.1 hypothetical protein PgNI_04958 [Pyricularia grisea]
MSAQPQQDQIHQAPAQPQAAYQTKAEQIQQGQQQQQYGPAAQHHHQHVGATPLQALGPAPAVIDCPFCQQRVMTRVNEEHSSMTYLLGVLIGCICICAACVPCLAGMCQDVTHFCTNCNQRVAHIPYSGGVQVIQPQPHQGANGQYNMGPQAVYGSENSKGAGGAPVAQQQQAAPVQQNQTQQQPAQQQGQDHIQPAPQPDVQPPQYSKN